MEGLKRKLNMQLVINYLNFLFLLLLLKEKNTSLLITNYLDSKAL